MIKPGFDFRLIEIVDDISGASDEDLYFALGVLERQRPEGRAGLERLVNAADIGRWLCGGCGATKLAGFTPKCPANCYEEMFPISAKLYDELIAARFKRGTDGR